MSSFLNVVATCLALALYTPLCMQILKGTAKQNLATWALWTVLDGIAAASLVVQHGNYLVVAAYTLGSAVVAMCILRSRNFAWTYLETLVSVLVILSVIGWAVAGPLYATVLSVAGLVLASIPQLVDSYRKPQDMPLGIYLGYGVANLLSLLAGKDWSIAERLYPGSALIMTLLMCACGLRKFFRKSGLQPSA